MTSQPQLVTGEDSFGIPWGLGIPRFRFLPENVPQVERNRTCQVSLHDMACTDIMCRAMPGTPLSLAPNFRYACFRSKGSPISLPNVETVRTFDFVNDPDRDANSASTIIPSERASSLAVRAKR